MIGALKAARKMSEEEFLVQVRAVLKSVYLDGIRDGVKLRPHEVNEVEYEKKWSSYDLQNLVQDGDQRTETNGG